METTANGWSILDKKRAILWREYSFGPALATTLVFRGAGDALIVVSPGNDLTVDALDELKTFGEVKALVASNGFHWLGHPLWRKHFPAARSFAPAQGIERIAKKLPELARFEDLSAIAPLLGDHATVTDAPGHKIGNAFVSVSGADGSFWYLSDLLANMPVPPKNPIFRALMALTDSAPGFRLFRPSVWLQVRDKKTVRAWIDDAFNRAPPATIVPAHGPPVRGSDLRAQAIAQLDRM